VLGELSERIAMELGADVTAVDSSERMVELTRAPGIDARVGDVQALPFEDGRSTGVQCRPSTPAGPG
jgi:ubiquinone/menaquinone biosynthesis C-methylase UbiE